ncbi:MAG TPA: DUF4013 domain-containing protein [Anaerolineaceae bacterium]|nr:DUF4013 domain-containing protein [Anaerolineaceae bacterium]
MNFPKSFTYIFEDPDWFSKLILPVLCSLIPIVGPLVMIGYTLHLIHNVAAREPRPLPQLDFGEDLARGFKWFVVTLIYVIPLVVLILLILVPVSVSNEKAPAIAAIFGILGGVAVLAYFVFLWLLMPIAEANFAVHGTISSGLEIGKFVKMFSKNVSAWLLVLVGGLLVGLIAPIGSILFFIGALITGTYASLMVSHLIGQAYSISMTGAPYTVTTATYAPQPPYNQPYTGQNYQPPITPQIVTPIDDHQPYNESPQVPPSPPVEPPQGDSQSQF